MLQLLYIFAFTVLAVLAVTNLVRNLLSLGAEARRGNTNPVPGGIATHPSRPRPVPHPELLDASGNVVDEPLLVMRSISIKDAREQLDAIYKASSSGTNDDNREE
jgi:hypothetical protein